MSTSSAMLAIRESSNGNGRAHLVKVAKRNGTEVPYDKAKILKAIYRCFINSKLIADKSEAGAIAEKVAEQVDHLLIFLPVPVTVEKIQDVVEQQLMANGYYDAAKAYIIYREEHKKLREEQVVDPAIVEAFEQGCSYFQGNNRHVQIFQALDKFARFNYDTGRREVWPESVYRVMKYTDNHLRSIGCGNVFSTAEWQDLQRSMLQLEAAPSMRLIQMAGPALDRCQSGVYNCSFQFMRSPTDLAEEMYLLCQGCGVGFSTEYQYAVDHWPRIKKQKNRKAEVFVVPDTTEGWCDAMKIGAERWIEGYDVEYDDHLVRPEGSILKTKGGRACLTGDTVVFKDRKKTTAANTLTIAELYEKRLKTPRRLRHIQIRCLDEATGTFQRNRVVDVIDNGVADVYEVTTENGYRIKATDTHRFMNADRAYQHLEVFRAGDLIAVNGAEIKSGQCEDCGTPVSRRAHRCRPCTDQSQLKPDANETTARGRKECQSHNIGVCAVCGRNDLDTQVHHKDRNPRNNAADNLLCVCEPCHRVLHATEDTFGNPYAHRYLSFDRIVSIRLAGRERVYDLQMESPNHNFVANGFVSHNSGPQPLRDCLKFARSRFLARQGGHLESIDLHDMVCFIHNISGVGGVRRASGIGLSDRDDLIMRHCKDGHFYKENPQRCQANNSAVYDERPTAIEFMEEWMALAKSGSGERGIFNRGALKKQFPERRKIGRYIMGCNPCGEINLRHKQFCNLSIAIARAKLEWTEILRRVRLAAIWGTIQSTMTKFAYIGPEWKKNCEDERLLGVDILGHLDHPMLRPGSPDLVQALQQAKRLAIDTNVEFAKRLGINPSAAVTCGKPGGDSSVFFDAAPGFKPWHGQYFIRRCRGQNNNPVLKMLKDQGVPVVTEAHTGLLVAEFPCVAPEGALVMGGWSALEQLEHWKAFKLNYTEHNPSVTINVKDSEWLAVGHWVYENWDIVGGLSFMPVSGAVYPLMPYETISEEEYHSRMANFPSIEWAHLVKYEAEDCTTASHTFSCTGDRCAL